MTDNTTDQDPNTDVLRVTTTPHQPDKALIHLPEFTYLDTQAWSLDVGIPADHLPALRDAITKHLWGQKEPGDQFHQARQDVEDIIGAVGPDTWVIVRHLWNRFRALPTAAEPPALAGQVPDRIAAEYHRRRTRYDSGDVSEHARANVAGELTGLLGALGMALGHNVAQGDADAAGQAYYEQWLGRQHLTTDQR